MRIVFLAAFAISLPALTLAVPAQSPQLPVANPVNQVISPRSFEQLRYRCVGPTRGGRVTTVTGVLQEQDTFYMGACGGGVWKTTDYGERWRNVSDGFFETGSIGAIRVARSNPRTVWVGTGSDGIRSNVITGRGVYKSTDAGATWQFMGLRDVGQIGAVEIHPQNPDIVYVAAIGMAFGPTPQRGVYRTRDGGASWEKVLFVSNTCGAVDLELNTANPDELYACMWRGERKPWTIISGAHEGGIYKSIDGGDNWRKIESGLPQGLFGKSDLAVSLADSNVVWALIEAPAPDGGLYRSNDHGDSFELVSTRRGLLDRPFYYCNVDVDPSDPETVYVNATGAHKSTDGGQSWRRMRTPHGDNHDMWIHPERPDLFIQSNDGGANVTRDGGRTWSTQRNQPTAELYQVAVDDRYPYWLYAGQQDNSTIRVPSAPVRGYRGGPDGSWQSVGGCETGPAIPKPGDPDIVYAACKGRFGVYNARTGQEKQYYVGMANMYGHNPKDLNYRFQRVSPIHVSPHDPNVIYHCSQFVHRSTDEGRTWETISPDLTAFRPETQVISGQPITRDITGEEFYSTLYSLRESAVQEGLIWVGSNDGPIHVSRDNGKSWVDVTPPDLPEGGRVQTVEPSPHQAGKAYVAVYRYLLGDWQPYIYRTDNYGTTWTRLTTGENGVPADYPTRVIREDPDREGLLYAGTEFGMFVSFDDGAHWQSLQLNLPRTPVTDIAVHRKDVVLSTMGRSFWILDDVTPLHQVDHKTGSKPVHLFQPRVSYRTRGSGRRSSRGRGSSSQLRVPEYAGGGAHIDYIIADAAGEEVRLEILDEKGEVVAKFASPRARRTTIEASASRQGEAGTRRPRSDPRMRSRSRQTTVQASPGGHRFVWNMATNSPGSRRGSSRAAIPGTYVARLTAGEFSQVVPFKVELDPRLAAEGVTTADLKEQAAFLARVGAIQARARDLQTKVRNWRRDLEDVIEKGGESGTAAEQTNRQLEALRDRLSTQSNGAYQQPMLISQLSYLASNVGRADQAPGNHAYLQLERLDQELGSCEAAYQKIPGPRPTSRAARPNSNRDN